MARGGYRAGAGRKPKAEQDILNPAESNAAPSEIKPQSPQIVVDIPRISRAQVRGAIREAVESKIGDLIPLGMKSPLAVLMEACNDKDLKFEARISAATAAAPYVHRRQPQAVEIAAVGPPVVIAFGVPPGAPELLGLLPQADLQAVAEALGATDAPPETPLEGL